MRKIYFALPGLGDAWACGGLWAELKILQLARDVASAELVTYHERVKDVLFLDDVLNGDDRVAFVVRVQHDLDVIAQHLS